MTEMTKEDYGGTFWGGICFIVVAIGISALILFLIKLAKWVFK